jgi:hypothetical protein
MPIDVAWRLRSAAGTLAALLLAGFPQGARAEAPLSAIDWLSQSVAPTGVGSPLGPADSTGAEPPVSADGAVPSTVLTTSLDAPTPDAAGLISPAVSGLPHDLWGGGQTVAIATALTSEKAEQIPALRQLFLTILLAEAEAPMDAEGKGTLLLARIDKLLALGALEQASALIAASGTMTPDLFRRSFDVALLTGRESRACEAMVTAPNLAPTFAARVFCLARSGDWNAAALTLRTGQALGLVGPVEDALLSRFLDPDLYEGEPVPLPPQPVTPLFWKMFEGIGEPLPTASMPSLAPTPAGSRRSKQQSG